MSLRARRARDENFDRHRALAAMREAVIAATVKRAPDAGSSATLDAVDEALAELYAAGAHSGELEQVAALWINVAYWRLVDEQRSTHVRRRERIAVEEHLQALSLSMSAELGDFTDERHVWWRVRELLAALHGEQRTWAEAWLRQVCGPLKPGAQPRGLDEVLGWSHAKTEKTAQRARSTMVAFVTQRARGALCRQQGRLLDAFTATSDTLEQAATLEQRFESALFHVAGCADCSAAWRARRRTLAERCSPALMLPLEGVTAAAHAVAARRPAGRRSERDAVCARTPGHRRRRRGGRQRRDADRKDRRGVRHRRVRGDRRRRADRCASADRPHARPPPPRRGRAQGTACAAAASLPASHPPDRRGVLRATRAAHAGYDGR